MPKQRQPRTNYHVPPGELPEWARPPEVAPTEWTAPTRWAAPQWSDQPPPPTGPPLSLMPPAGPVTPSVAPPEHPMGELSPPPVATMTPPSAPVSYLERSVIEHQAARAYAAQVAATRPAPPQRGSGGLVAVLVVILAAISVVGYLALRPRHSAPVATVPANLNAPPTNLSAELLGGNDMPSGWQAFPSPLTRSGAPNLQTGLCPKTATAAAITRDQFASAQAAAAYRSSTGSSVQEILGFFGTSAPTEFSQATAEMNACGAVSLAAGGTRLNGTVRPVGLPPLGDQTSGYAVPFSATIDGRQFEISLVFAVVRVHQTLMIIVYTGVGAPDTGTTVGFAQTAAAKVS